MGWLGVGNRIGGGAWSTEHDLMTMIYEYYGNYIYIERCIEMK